MTHKNGEWFRGKPEQTENYMWGNRGEYPDMASIQMEGVVVVKDLRRYQLSEDAWWVRVGDLYPIPPVPVPRPEKIDTPVLVSGDGSIWYRRYLAGWTEDGKIQTWFNGRTSWSANEATTRWAQWKLPEAE